MQDRGDNWSESAWYNVLMNDMERGAVSRTFGFFRLQCYGSQNCGLPSPAYRAPLPSCPSPQIRKPHVANPSL